LAENNLKMVAFEEEEDNIIHMWMRIKRNFFSTIIGSDWKIYISKLIKIRVEYE
jgi:hypothetical protein